MSYMISISISYLVYDIDIDIICDIDNLLLKLIAALNRTVCAWSRLFLSTSNLRNSLIPFKTLTWQELARYGMLGHSFSSHAWYVLVDKRQQWLRTSSYLWYFSTHSTLLTCRHRASWLTKGSQCCVRMHQARCPQCTFVPWQTCWDGFHSFHAIWMDRLTQQYRTVSGDRIWEAQ